MSAGLDVEAVMSAHKYQHGSALGQFCSCGEVGHPNPELLLTMQDWHRAHVAAKVREAVAAWIESEAVVRPAAEAMEDAAFKYLGRDLGTIHRDDIAAAALSALAEAVRDA